MSRHSSTYLGTWYVVSRPNAADHKPAKPYAAFFSVGAAREYIKDAPYRTNDTIKKMMLTGAVNLPKKKTCPKCNANDAKGGGE